MDYTRKASIQRKTLWQQIADVLREDIIRGKIKPGERIVEEDIAEKFHVSRGPVREALRHIGPNMTQGFSDRSPAYMKLLRNIFFYNSFPRFDLPPNDVFS